MSKFLELSQLKVVNQKCIFVPQDFFFKKKQGFTYGLNPME